METLRREELYARLSKYSFRLRSIPFLGHIITGEGISVDPKKIQAVTDWPAPKTTKQVRRFVGIAGYYRRFVNDFSKLAAPMTKLTRKGEKFVWSEKCTEAFEISINDRTYIKVTIRHRGYDYLQ